MIIRIFIYIIPFLLLSLNLLAQNTNPSPKTSKKGPLPKGKIVPNFSTEFLVQQKNTDNTKNTEQQQTKHNYSTIRSCHNYYSGNVSGEAYLDYASNVLYYLGRYLSDNVSTGHKYSYVLYQIFYKENNPNKFNKLFSFDGDQNVALLAHNSPPHGFTFISFESPLNWCYEGKGFGFSVPFVQTNSKILSEIKIKPVKTLMNSIYKILDGTINKFIVDLEKFLIKDIDIVFFQTRTVGGFNKGEIPLYLTHLSNILITLTPKPEIKIKAHNVITKKEIWNKTLNINQKIYITESALVVINYEKNNTLKLDIYYPLEKDKQFVESFNLQLVDSIADITNVNLKINLPYKAAVFTGGGEAVSRKKMDKIFIYNYVNNKPISILQLKPEHYCSNFIFDQDGKNAIFFINKKSDDTHSSIKIFDFVNSKWKVVDIK